MCCKDWMWSEIVMNLLRSPKYPILLEQWWRWSGWLKVRINSSALGKQNIVVNNSTINIDKMT